MIIQIEISDEEVKCLEHDLLDINQWVQDAVKGKINNCKARMCKEWTARLIADPAIESIPAKEPLLIAAIHAHKDYKNRAAREALEAR